MENRDRKRYTFIKVSFKTKIEKIISLFYILMVILFREQNIKKLGLHPWEWKFASCTDTMTILRLREIEMHANTHLYNHVQMNCTQSDQFKLKQNSTRWIISSEGKSTHYSNMKWVVLKYLHMTCCQLLQNGSRSPSTILQQFSHNFTQSDSCRVNTSLHSPTLNRTRGKRNRP